MTRTAASTRTGEAAAGKNRSQTPWSIDRAGPRRPAGPSGERYLRTFRIITPKGRGAGLEAGTGKRRSSRQQLQQQQQQVNILLSSLGLLHTSVGFFSAVLAGIKIISCTYNHIRKLSGSEACARAGGCNIISYPNSRQPET